ncbi:MAG: hypothetical protein U0703_01930 [Anaerolineae bacterium]
MLAPRELELDAILRSVRNPPGEDDLQPRRALPGWLREDYPLLFGEPGVNGDSRAVQHRIRSAHESPPPATRRQRIACARR